MNNKLTKKDLAEVYWIVEAAYHQELSALDFDEWAAQFPEFEEDVKDMQQSAIITRAAIARRRKAIETMRAVMSQFDEYETRITDLEFALKRARMAHLRTHEKFDRLELEFLERMKYALENYGIDMEDGADPPELYDEMERVQKLIGYIMEKRKI